MFTVSVSPCTEQLNRECSLFSDDGKFVIIGSAAPLPEEPHPPFYSIYQAVGVYIFFFITPLIFSFLSDTFYSCLKYTNTTHGIKNESIKTNFRIMSQ